MTPPSERKAKERQAKRDAGLVRVEVWVPRAVVDEVREQVGKIARSYTEADIDGERQ